MQAETTLMKTSTPSGHAHVTEIKTSQIQMAASVTPVRRVAEPRRQLPNQPNFEGPVRPRPTESQQTKKTVNNDKTESRDELLKAVIRIVYNALAAMTRDGRAVEDVT